MEEIVDLSKDDVTQKPREGQIRRDKVQWTAMRISLKRKDAKRENTWKHCSRVAAKIRMDTG